MFKPEEISGTGRQADRQAGSRQAGWRHSVAGHLARQAPTDLKLSIVFANPP